MLLSQPWLCTATLGWEPGGAGLWWGWGGGLYFLVSHCVPPSPAVSWAPRSLSASGRTPRTSRWQMWPTRLVSWPGVLLVLLLSSLPGCGVPLARDWEEGTPTMHPSSLGFTGEPVWGWQLSGVPLSLSLEGSLGGRGHTPLTISLPSTEHVKAELEADLGLKIVQTGVGEVGVSMPVPWGWGSQAQGGRGAATRNEPGIVLYLNPGAWESS